MQNLPIIRNLTKKQYEVVSYLFFGGLATLVNLVCYALFVEVLGLGITAGNIIALIISILFAFVTNKLWVFRSKSWELKLLTSEAVKFFSSRAATAILEIVGVPLLYQFGLDYPLFGIYGFAAKAIMTVIVIILNYVFSKFIVFKKS